MKKIIRYILFPLWLLTSLSLMGQISKLQTYGFFDLEAEWNNATAEGKNWTFDQHHFNVLSSYDIDERFRVFSEIEWEHGPSHDAESTTGTIYLARAYLDYRYAESFKIMAGKFLPPFGIYNERHDATPTFLFTLLPQSIYGKHSNPAGGTQRIFSKFMTGVQVNGVLFSNDWELEYAVYAGNGRGDEPSKKDDNANKGFGAHLKLTHPGQNVVAGISFYQDKNGLALNLLQRVIAVDLQILFDAVEFELEGALPSSEKLNISGQPSGSMQNGFAGYVQMALPVSVSLTPFLRYEYYDPDNTIVEDSDQRWVAGLNYAVTSNVYLKAAWHDVRSADSRTKDYQLFLSSVAVAF